MLDCLPIAIAAYAGLEVVFYEWKRTTIHWAKTLLRDC
jgi:hypothetical protein